MFGDPSSTSMKLQSRPSASFFIRTRTWMVLESMNSTRKVDQEPGTGEERIAQGLFEPRRGFQVVLSLQHEQCDVGPRPGDFDPWFHVFDLDVRETSHHVYPPK